MKNKIIIAIGIIAVLISVFVFATTNKKTNTEEKVERPLTVNDIQKVVGVARIEPEDGFLNITAGTEGKILELSVNENEIVTKGQTLAVVSTDVEQMQLKQAQSKLAGQKAAIQAGEATLKSNEAAVKSATTSAAAIKVEVDKAQQNYDLNQKLFDKKAITKQTLDNSKFDLDKLIKDYEEALNNIEQNKANLAESKANLNQTKASLTAMKTDVAYYQTVLKEKRITAPTDAKVLEWEVNVGDYVEASTSLGEFSAQGKLVAITEIDEVFAERVKIGQSATVQAQSTGKTIATGKITFVADFLKKKSLFTEDGVEEDRRVRTIEIRLDNVDKVLIGSKVDCIISLN